MKTDFLDAARDEFKDAVDYHNAQRPGLGDEFKHEVAAAIVRIKGWPYVWTRASRRARMCRVKRFPYLVVYVPSETEILVVAIMHGHRRPGYWRKRLKGLGP